MTWFIDTINSDNPAAEEDLINIWVYVARGNQGAADRVYEAAEGTCELFVDFLRIGLHIILGVSSLKVFVFSNKELSQLFHLLSRTTGVRDDLVLQCVSADQQKEAVDPWGSLVWRG